MNTIIFPFNAANDNEGKALKFSLRSLERFVDPRNYEVCVVGDAPDWFVGKTIHVPYITQRLYFELFGSVFHERWRDVVDYALKLSSAAQCDEVSSEFIVVQPDTYFFDTFNIMQFLVPSFRGMIGTVKKPRTIRQELMVRTKNVLNEHGLSNIFFDHGYPVPFSKNQILDYFEKYNPMVMPGFFATLYHNTYEDDVYELDGDDFFFFGWDANTYNRIDLQSITERCIGFEFTPSFVFLQLEKIFREPSKWERRVS